MKVNKFNSIINYARSVSDLVIAKMWAALVSVEKG